MDATCLQDFEPRYTRALVELWRRSFEHGVGITDPHPLEEQIAFFESHVLAEHRVRVALGGPGASELLGFIASTPQSVAQLYVAVPHLRRGIGSRMLALAQAESSGGLWLYTFARNTGARAFYERHGFVDTGHGFENMWNLEDIRYEWAPTPRPSG